MLKPRNCTKPGLPTLLYVAFALWLSTAASYYFLRYTDNLNIVKVLAVISILVAVFSGLCLLCLHRRRVLVFVAIACLMGICLGALESVNIRAKSEMIDGNAHSWQLTLESDAKASTLGKSAVCTAKRSDGKTIKVQAYFDKEAELLTSETIQTNASLKSLEENSSEYSYMQGISANITVKNFEKISNNVAVDAIVNLRRKTIENLSEFGGSQAGILQALVCGYRNTIQEDNTYDKYKICGLAHMVAVSGAHLAIVVMLLLYILQLLIVSKKLSILICSIFVAFYVIFAGIPISAVRAAIMVALSMFSYFGKRSATPLNALAICLIAFIVLDPVTSVSVSLFLSSASTFSILVFARLFESWLDTKSKRINKLVVSPIAMTASANLATLPFSAALFSQVSTIALLTNVFITPFFSIACTGGVALSALALCFPALAKQFIFLSGILCIPITTLVNLFSSIPYASIAVSLNQIAMLTLTIICVAALFLIWPKLQVKQVFFCAGGLAICLASFIFISPLFVDDEIVMLDIGQGDSILFRSGGKQFLIDTGTNDSQLRSEMAKNGIHRLDGVMISHHDDDHMGSLSSLATYVQITDIYISSNTYDCTCKNCKGLISELGAINISGEVRGISVGDIIRLGSFSFDVISPDTFKDEGGNGDSLVVKCERGSPDNSPFISLFGGDAEKDTLSSIIDNGRIGDIDILKVSHHGSKKSVDEAVLDVLKPEVSIISVGANNRYGHPTEECLRDLEHAGSVIYRTDKQGEISITFDGDGYKVRTEK